MSRLYLRNSRGRQPLLQSNAKTPIAREHNEDASLVTGKRKRKLNERHKSITPQIARRRKIGSPSSDVSSIVKSEAADDASDEDSQSEDDNDEEPAFIAPSRSKIKLETGQKKRNQVLEETSVVGDNDANESMFGDYDDYYEDDEDPNMSPEENRKHFESRVFAESDDDDNDDSYRAVDEISDSDESNVEQMEEQQLMALLSEDELEEAQFYLNQIDGMSEYGFGDDTDASGQFPPSSAASESPAETSPRRHVHFEVGVKLPSTLSLSESPTMSRALLPSALPDLPNVPKSPSQSFIERQHGSILEDPDDSDLTDDCLPEEAHHNTPNALQNRHDEDENVTPAPSSPPKRSSKKASRRKGPPRGIFIDEGDKASGILDPTGKIILMTNPHLLGEDFARKYGTSPSSSPDIGFEELFDESEAGDTSSQRAADALQSTATDIMLASLNTALNDPTYQGQATGPLEAFYPAPGFDIGDYALDPDDMEGDFLPDPELGEDVINLEDVIRFDEDSNDDSDSPTSPIFMPPNHELYGEGNVNNHFTHLTNTNVTAFRRSADPHLAAAISRNTPTFYDLSLFGSPPRTRRKRKLHTSPYHSSHYEGVTPVQRMRAPEKVQNSDPEPRAPKRRRITT